MNDRPKYKDLKARWDRVRAAEAHAYRRAPKPRLPREQEIAAGLDALYAATGNADYASAFEALQKDGSNRRRSWKWTPLREKNADAVYLDRMHWLVQQQRHSQRHAAALVAVEFFIPGKTFDAVVNRLELAYRNFEKKGRVV
jgi:hypothetical protein